MRFLDRTLGEIAADLALDEGLLAEVEGGAEEALRVWEPRETCVVMGRSSVMDREVRVAECRARGVPVLRRGSGGGSVVLAPGCLAFALALALASTPQRSTTAGTYAEVCARHALALTQRLGVAIAHRGYCDLARGESKVGGCAQRRRRHAVLVHGTLLCGMDLTLADELLERAQRPPPYRAGRSHAEFLANLPLSPAEARETLRGAWDASLVPASGVY